MEELNIEEAKKYGLKVNSLSNKVVDDCNKQMFEQHKEEYQEFLSFYEKDECYICKKSFKTISKDKPCLHWLLRKCKFKNKDFKLIANKFGYFQISVYLRWVANSEKFQVNINDLVDEKTEKKVFQSTIKWKNIEWSFDCAEGDLAGHEGAHLDFPHYHFQMTIDKRPFIKYNSNHNKFTQQDLSNIYAAKEHDVKLYYGAFAEGMQDAVSVPPEKIIERSHVREIGEENTGAFSFTSIISNPDGIDMDIVQDAMDESRKTKKPFQSILNEKLKDDTNIATIITPSDNVPEIAKRTEHYKK